MYFLVDPRISISHIAASTYKSDVDKGLFSKEMSKSGGGFIASCEFRPSLFGVQINRPHFQILRAVGRSRVTSRKD
jgi:hypothetical protein